MRRGVSIVLMLLALGCATVSPQAPHAALQSPTRATTLPLAGAVYTVVLDAGHGGHDPGTSHFGLKEKVLTLDIAKRLCTSLQEAGLSVVMTRDTDRFIPLSGRSDIANRLQADLFVSVHVNASKNHRTSGIEVYYPRVSVVSAGAQWPPSVRPSEIGVPSTTVKRVLWDLVLGQTRSQSRRLAFALCRTMHNQLQAPCLGVRPARFVVLREAWMPSVLVEVGYVSNQSEAQRLASAEYRQAAAESIAEGIVAYIRELGGQHI